MMEVDARGYSCPIPVVMVQKALQESPAGVTAIVDSAVAKENVTRLAKSCGYQAAVKQDGSDYTLTITKA